MAMKNTKILGRQVQTISAGERDVERSERWVGVSDGIDHDVFVPVTPRDQNDTDVVGILVHTSRVDGLYFGYSIVTTSDEGDGHEADDIHTSLRNLCDEYDIDNDLVVDRIAMALLSATKPTSQPNQIEFAAEALTMSVRRLAEAGMAAFKAVCVKGASLAEVEKMPEVQAVREAERAWHEAGAAYVSALIGGVEA